MKSTLSVSCAYLILLILATADGHSQVWQKLQTFAAPANAPCFLASYGHPERGVIGVGYSVFYTTNKGQSWQQSNAALTGYVRCFCFRDSLNGWVGTEAMELFNTTDGGATWNRMALPHLAYSKINAIYYLPSRHRLFVSVWPNSSAPASTYTDDGGATWTVLGTSYGDTGFGFVDASTGILASDCSLGCGWSRTTDGGATWTQDQNKVHSWQPQAIPWSSSFVALTDNYGDVVRSTDAGVTWASVGRLSFTVGGSTGDLELDSCGNLYCQSTFNTGFGVHMSEDGGATWTDLGGPDGVVDSRFCVAGRDIYTAEGNILWVLRRTTFADRTDITVPNPCESRDTTLSFLRTACNSLRLLAVSSSDSVSLLPHLDAPMQVLPQSSCPVLFTVRSINGGSDSVTLTYTYETLGVKRDTSIVIALHGVPDDPVLSYQSQVLFPSIPLCDSSSKELIISNPNCDEIVIDSVRSASPFKAVGSSQPILIPSGLSGSAFIRYVPEVIGTAVGTARIYYHTKAGIHRDTLQQLVASSTDAPIYNLSLSSTALSEFAGAQMHIPVYIQSPSSPNVLLTSGIDKLEAAFELNTDLLSIESVTSTIPGVSVEPLQRTPTGILLAIHIPPGFDPVFTTELLRINLHPAVSDSVHGTVRLSKFGLPAETSICSRLQIPQAELTFDLKPQCGDSILTSFMRFGRFAIGSINPNPAEHMLRVSFEDQQPKLMIAIEVLDPLGKVVCRATTNTSECLIDLGDLAEGAYFLRATSNGRIATSSLQVRR